MPPLPSPDLFPEVFHKSPQLHYPSSMHLRLMVSHKYNWSLLQSILSTHTSILLHASGHPKSDTSYPPHAVFGRPCNRPLAQPAIAHSPQTQTSKDTVECATHHDDEGRGDEGVVLEKLCWLLGKHEGERAHEYDECGWHGGEVEEPAHGERWALLRAWITRYARAAELSGEFRCWVLRVTQYAIGLARIKE